MDLLIKLINAPLNVISSLATANKIEPLWDADNFFPKCSFLLSVNFGVMLLTFFFFYCHFPHFFFCLTTTVGDLLLQNLLKTFIFSVYLSADSLLTSSATHLAIQNLELHLEQSKYLWFLVFWHVALP